MHTSYGPFGSKNIVSTQTSAREDELLPSGTDSLKSVSLNHNWSENKLKEGTNDVSVIMLVGVENNLPTSSRFCSTIFATFLRCS